ncbi:MAG: hypothetical protein L0I76_00985 [Pseudonocardia sp.]|nr:hypothetical protein [Pseudonocardia sp.]
MTTPQFPQQAPPPGWETFPVEGGSVPAPPGGAPDDPVRPGGGRRRVVVIVAVLLLVLGTVGGLLWWSIGPGSRPKPAEAVSAAIDDLRNWELIGYRGEVTPTGSPDLTIDVTVDRNGDMAGTLTRPDGVRAEYARIDGVELLKAESRWYDDGNRTEDKAARLGGRWVKNPSGEVTGLDSDLLAPAALAADLDTPGLRSTVSSFSPYEEGEPEQVDGGPARRLEGSTKHLLVSDGDDPRLLAVQETNGSAAPTPLRVVPAGPEARAGIDAARTASTTAADYMTRLFQRAEVELAWEPGAMRPCTTPTCSVRVKVTNPEDFDARGTLRVTLKRCAGGRASVRAGGTQIRGVHRHGRQPGQGAPGSPGADGLAGRHDHVLRWPTY